MKSSWNIVSVLSILAITTGCGATRANSSHVSRAAAGATPLATEMLTAWLTGSTSTTDGVLHLAVKGPGTAILADQIAGAYTDVRTAPSQSSSVATLLAQSTAGTTDALVITSSGSITKMALPEQPIDAHGILWDGQALYMQSAPSFVVGLKSDGAIVSRYKVPIPVEVSTAGTFDGVPRRGVSTTGTSVIRGIVRTPDGHLLVASSNGDGAVVQDLDSGQRIDLGDSISQLSGLMVSPDGYLYTTGWDYTHSNSEINLIRIDLSTMQVTKTFPTGVMPNSSTSQVDGIDLIPWQKAAALVIAFGRPGPPITQHVFVVSGDALNSVATVPNALMASARDSSSIFVYGGASGSQLRYVDQGGFVIADLLNSSPTGSRLVATVSVTASPA